MHIANTDVHVLWRTQNEINQNRRKENAQELYNPIPHPALDTKLERKTHNLDGIK